MSAHSKKAQLLARQLFRLSLENGAVSPERVSGALTFVGKHKPANPLMVLKAYRRLVESELAKSRAVVEHAGAVSDSILQRLAAALTKRYGRAITTAAQPNAALLAGVRVRVGDDVYESSIAGQLAALAAAT